MIIDLPKVGFLQNNPSMALGKHLCYLSSNQSLSFNIKGLWIKALVPPSRGKAHHHKKKHLFIERPYRTSTQTRHLCEGVGVMFPLVSSPIPI